jgi:peptide/nickel transport system permease protein
MKTGWGWSIGRREPSVGFGAVLLAALCLLAAWPGAWLPHDPLAQDLLRRLDPPSATYWLGTDMLGRCVFSRAVAAARVSLGAALGASAAICAIALLWGLLAAWASVAADAARPALRWLDALLMRSADVLLGFPTLVLALAIIGVAGASLAAVLVALVVAWAPGLARVVRTLAQQALARDYVAAARAAGLPEPRVLVRHVLPQLLAPLAVLASLETAGVMLAMSALSFLGLGVQPPAPEWGAMLNEARPFIETAPHLLWGPGLAVFGSTLTFNLIGEGLRDRLDVRTPLRW